MMSPDIAVQSDPSAPLTRDIVTEPRLRRWTREEYYQMLDAGILTSQDKVQLIEGEIVEMTPQKSPHATAVLLAYRLFHTAASDQQHARSQLPLALGSFSEPEPDVAIVVGSPRDYQDEHPTNALLVIEVSDSSLKFDRTTKARIYGRAGIPEYWIVNLQDRCVEVRRDPVTAAPPKVERGYMTVTIHRPGESITPLAMPQQSIAVDDLLPLQSRTERET